MPDQRDEHWEAITAMRAAKHDRSNAAESSGRESLRAARRFVRLNWRSALLGTVMAACVIVLVNLGWR